MCCDNHSSFYHSSQTADVDDVSDLKNGYQIPIV